MNAEVLKAYYEGIKELKEKQQEQKKKEPKQ